jgi:hypothetical protein
LSTRSAADSWSLLRSRGQTSDNLEVLTLQAGVMADAGPVRFALGPKAEGRLLLPISSSERIPAIPETPTLQIKEYTYSSSNGSSRFLDLTCLAGELDGVFAEVSDEIVRRIADGKTALQACISALSEFRQLLVPKTSAVEKADIIGLVGELLLLDELLDIGPDACQIWRGPIPERHDFRAGKLAAEVKTSGRSASNIMHVTSIDQLLEPEGGELCLVRFTLEEAKGGSLTVKSLASRISAKVSDPILFRDLLTRVQCPDPASDDWNTHAFELEETLAYRVCDSFPRIIPPSLVAGGLPAGTGGLNYEVDLAAAQRCLLSADDRAEYLARMVSCISIA